MLTNGLCDEAVSDLQPSKPQSRPSEHLMTIGIAASCADGRAVVVASDRMLSAPFLTVEFDHQDTKIDQISDNCVALSSGDALCVQDVLIGGVGAASHLQNPPIKTIADQIKMQFCEIRKQRVNDMILGPRGIDFDSFYQGGIITRFPPDLAMLLDSQVQTYALGTVLLMAGVDDSGAHIHCIDDPGKMACFDRVGYHAIGSGHRHALLKLVALNQHRSTSINETVFNVFCAKKIAELAPGVGQATSVKIVFRTETRVVEQKILDGLEPAYREQANPTNESVREAVDALPFSGGSEHDPTE